MNSPQHEEIRAALALAAAGALDPAAQRRVEQHTDSCAQCAAALAALSSLAGGLRSMPAPAVPPGLAARAQARLRLRQGAAREERVSGAIVLFLTLFAWTVTLLPWLVSRVIGGALVLWGIRLGHPLVLLGGSTLLAWLTGGVTVLVLLRSPRREGRVS